MSIDGCWVLGLLHTGFIYIYIYLWIKDTIHKRACVTYWLTSDHELIEIRFTWPIPYVHVSIDVHVVFFFFIYIYTRTVMSTICSYVHFRRRFSEDVLQSRNSRQTDEHKWPILARIPKKRYMNRFIHHSCNRVV